MLMFLLVDLQIESIEEMGNPGRNQDWNQEPLPYIEWASVEDAAIVHFKIIYDCFIIFGNVIFRDLNYNPGLKVK